MNVILAKTAGYCYGVKIAVDRAYQLVGNRNIVTYGPIIHNKIVISDLAAKGIAAVESLSGLPEDSTVLIRSHGVRAEIYAELEKKYQFIDCTCPDVKKNQLLACSEYESGREIIILGDPRHPEIEALSSWAGSALIIENPEDIGKIDISQKYSLLAQTTFESSLFKTITEKISADYPALDIRIFNTVCKATEIRQEEADELSKKVDVMLVLGDKLSSNTKKLFEICKKNCPRSFLVESFDEIMLNIFNKDDMIGITAGASTPPGIIKEAFLRMSETEINRTENFEEMLDGSLVTLHTGNIVKGKVISVTNGEVSVGLGFKSDGLIPKGEFSDDPNVDPAAVLKPGDEIEVFVVRVNDGEGNVQLSKKKVDSEKGLVEIEAAVTSTAALSGRITEVIKGGVIAIINGVRCFVPSSQVSNRFVEDLNSLKGQVFNFNILEFDKSKRRIVAGRKELAGKEYAENRAKIFETVHAGDKIDGTVTRITDFGAFVDIGGVDGLIHVSEMSWSRIKKVTDVLSVGANVTATVLDVNPEKGKISLSLKDVTNDPWNNITERYPIGSIVGGKVVRMASFGAFVELEPGIDGLVHISQIADKHVVKPEDELKIGEIITIKITDINTDSKKISLSKKAAEAPVVIPEAFSADITDEPAVYAEPEVQVDSEA